MISRGPWSVHGRIPPDTRYHWCTQVLCTGYVYLSSLYLLGHVAIIAYDHLLLCNSLFQEVLKRSGTFEKSKKFSKIR